MRFLKKNFTIFILLLVDLIAIFASLQCALFIRTKILTHFMELPLFPQTNFSYYWWFFYVWIFFLAYEGLYTNKFPFWDEVKMIWKAAFFSTLGVFSILYLGKFGENVSRILVVTMGMVSLFIFPLIRLNMKKLLIYSGLLRSKVLILGAGSTGRLILNALKKDKNYGLHVVGFLDDDKDKIGKKINGIKIHSGVDKAQKYIGKCGIEDVIIAMPGCDKNRLIALINKLQHKAQNIILIPDLFGITVLGTNLQHFFQEQAIGLQVKNNLAEPINLIIKKIFDITVSFILFIILAVPMLLFSILIKTTSSGPAIYSHNRIGKNGRSFKCYKFRTMYNDADIRLEHLLKKSEESKIEWDHHWKLTNDPRITNIGKFLRQTSLDELPQIINVIKGEMSLVGPRPVTKKEIDEYYKDQALLCFGVTPGVTGLWQVSGRSNTSYDYRIALDSWYVRNWNLWLDIVILFKTIKVVFKSEGAK